MSGDSRDYLVVPASTLNSHHLTCFHKIHDVTRPIQLCPKLGGMSCTFTSWEWLTMCIRFEAEKWPHSNHQQKPLGEW